MKLSDKKLSDLHREVTEESRRRALAAVTDAGVIIRGHEGGKRAIRVAAVGGHSILFAGPAGCGKSLMRGLATELGVVAFEALCCPCGRLTDPHAACPCTLPQIKRHQLTWPAAEMYFPLSPVTADELNSKRPGISANEMRTMVREAAGHASLDLGSSELFLLKRAQEELGFDARTRDTIVRVARSIANLEQEALIKQHHVAEAVQYRCVR